MSSSYSTASSSHYMKFIQFSKKLFFKYLYPVKVGALLGMGNPLLDISATVKPELLTKHNLKSNDAILTEEENIFNDLKDGYQVDKPILSPALPLQSSHQSFLYNPLTSLLPLQSSHQSPSFAILSPVLPLQSSHQSFLCVELAVCSIFSDPVNCM